MPSVSVVVLSYNRPELLARALRSVVQQTHTNREILVVDNASPASERVRRVVEGFSGVRLVANPTNAGFTGGMNQGLAEATAEYIYLTEDDVELAPDCVEKLVVHLAARPDAGLAGPVMWNRERQTVRCAGGQFTFGTVYRMSVREAGSTTLRESEPYQTMYLPGASIAAGTAFLRAVGGFHRDFFMYGEDVELCARVLEAGRSVWVVPSARVYHHEPPEHCEDPVLAYHRHKNLFALYLLHAPLRVLPGFFMRYGLIEGARRLARPSPEAGAWLSAFGFATRRSLAWLAQRSSPRVP